MRAVSTLVWSLMALALLAAACSDDDSDPAPSAAATPEIISVEVEDVEGGIDPTSAEIGDPLEVLGDVTTAVIELYDESELAETDRGVDRTTIRVGGLVTEQVGDIAIFPGLCAGAEARFARANADRELAPRSIDFLGCADDAGDPEENRNIVAEYAGFSDVFAVTPATSLVVFDDELLLDQRVPYIGLGTSPMFCGYDRPLGISQSGAVDCPVITAAGLVLSTVDHVALAESLAEEEDPTLVWVGLDSPAGRARVAAARFQAERVGVDLVVLEDEIPPPTAVEPTGWDDVVDLVADQAPGVVIIDGRNSIGLYEALLTSGDVEARVVGLSFGDPQELTDDPELRSALAGSFQVVQGVQPAGPSPGWAQLTADVRLLDDPPDGVGLGFVYGYVAADVLVAAIADTPEPLTVEAMINAVNGGWRYPGVEGLACGGWFPAGHLAAFPCASVVQISPLGDPVTVSVPLTEFAVAVFDPAE